MAYAFLLLCNCQTTVEVQVSKTRMVTFSIINFIVLVR